MSNLQLWRSLIERLRIARPMQEWTSMLIWAIYVTLRHSIDTFNTIFSGCQEKFSISWKKDREKISLFTLYYHPIKVLLKSLYDDEHDLPEKQIP